MGCAVPVSTRAGEIWSGASLTDNKWTTPDNWMPMGAPANDGSANVIMMGPGRTNSLVDVPWSIRSIAFPAGVASFSISGSALSIGDGGISNSSGIRQIIANDISLTAPQNWDISSDLNLSGAISGSFGFVKGGEGALILNGVTANSYTGVTTINAGTLLLNKTAANGAVIGPLTIGDGAGTDVVRWMANEQLWHGAGAVVNVNNSGLMDLNGFSETIRDLNINGGKVATGTGTLTVMGAITSSAAANSAFISDRLSLGSGTRTINVGDGAGENDLVIDASIASGGLTKSGAGTLLMIGSPNTYLGTTTVLEGTLALAKSGADSAIKGDLMIGGGAAPLAVVILGANEQIQAVGNSVSLAPNGSLVLNNFNETIGDLDMSGGSISGGTLTVLGEVNSLGASSTAQISSNLNLGGISRAFSVAAGPLAVDMDISAAISNGGLMKNGPGTLMLSGPATSGNTFSGVTTVNQGKLILNKAGLDGAINGNLTIGDGVGGAGADVVHLEADEQIKADASNWLTVNASGLLELNGHAETISNLGLSGGMVTTGPSSSGVLKLMGSMMSGPAATTSTISGRLDLGGAMRTMTVADGAAAIDLSITAIVSNGGLSKAGDGKLRLLGNLYASGTVLSAGTLLLASDFALGTGALTINGGMLEAEGSPTLNNAIVIQGAAAVVGAGNLRLNGAITSNNVLSKRGGGILTISGPQNNSTGAALNVLGGRVNLNSSAGALATASSAASANLVLRIGKGEALPSLVVLGSNQQLAGLELPAAMLPDSQGLDLNSPPQSGAFRAVSVYASDVEAAKQSIYAAVANANAAGAADLHDGIFDSGLSAHPGAKIGVAIVADARGTARVLIRPTILGDLNLDGVVTISDFIDLASKFETPGPMTWQEGDLNYDGHVSISDFIDLAANFNSAYDAIAATPASGGAVPEPSSMIVLAVTAMFARRRRA